MSSIVNIEHLHSRKGHFFTSAYEISFRRGPPGTQDPLCQQIEQRTNWSLWRVPAWIGKVSPLGIEDSTLARTNLTWRKTARLCLSKRCFCYGLRLFETSTAFVKMVSLASLRNVYTVLLLLPGYVGELRLCWCTGGRSRRCLRLLFGLRRSRTISFFESPNM